MHSVFWHTLGSKLGERWAAATAPAVVFWIGGLLAWAYGRDGLHSLAIPATWLDRQSTPAQIAAIAAVLAGVTASGLVVQFLTTPFLRLLEGYWPSWTEPLRSRLISRRYNKAIKENHHWQQLADRVHAPAVPSAKDLADYARLERRRLRRPTTPDHYLPTKIGNILRAAERRPANKYGLDAVALWPRLWLLLPDATRRELIAARASLDSAVAAALWGLLFCAFTPWTPLVIPIGLIIAAAAMTLWVPTHAALFADLIEATYDLHRTVLYQQLRWPLPVNPKEEQAEGTRLTAYLWRGSDSDTPIFTPAPPP